MASSERNVIETLRALGIAPELIDRAVERGDPEGAIFDSVLLPWQAERTVSASDIEAAGGIPAERVQALIEAAGITPPTEDQPAFTIAEAHVFVELERLREMWPAEIATQVMRVYGRQLAQIAQSSVQLFRVYVERRLRAEGGEPLAVSEAVGSAFASLVPLAEPLLVGVYRRWLEHELAQQAVSEVEASTAMTLPGAVQVTFLFCDLKDFTLYADREGDQAAVAAIDRFVEVVSRERGGRCRFQKLLGDGVMLTYDHAEDAVRSGARIMAGMQDTAMPHVHASAHRGVAILREGDYFGTTVNIAARLVAEAGRDELLATRSVVEACGPGFRWEPAATVRVRGVNEPVDVSRLASSS